MARRGENIYKRKDGRYEGRYVRERRPDGRICWGYVYGREYRAVRQELLRRKAMCPAKPQSKESLAGWVALWLETRVRPYVKAGTYAGYKRCAERHILPALGGCTLAELTAGRIQTLVDGLAARLAPSTLRGVCRLLKAILREAVRAGRLAASPYVGVRLPRATAQKPRVLTRSEQRQLEMAAREDGHYEYLLFLYGGLRLGELCALRWSDIDFAEGTLTVRRTVQRVAREQSGAKTALVFGPPKSEAGRRRVPLPGFLLQLLAGAYKADGREENHFVLAGPGGGCIDPRSLQRRFARLAAALGLQAVHIHTLRHTYAARCREAGIGYEVLAELMGHATPSVTILFYGGCTVDEKRENVGRLRLIA